MREKEFWQNLLETMIAEGILTVEESVKIINEIKKEGELCQ